MKYRAEDTEADHTKAAERGTSDLSYRSTDDPEMGEEHLRRRRHYAARVLFLSVICSGLVALIIVYTVELGARNNAVESCGLEMQTRLILAEQADDAADGVLGDPKEKPPIPRFRFEGTAFEDFKPLIIAQARANRRRSDEFARTVRDCRELFPRPKLFGFIG